jgi:tetratricopeptide (TPR) repeat protein
MKSLFIFCLFFISEISFAQTNLEKQLNYANELFDSTNYFDAVTEYKRLIFFDKEKEYYWEANFKIGVCYKYGGFYDEAIRYLRIAEMNGNTSDEILESKFQIVRCNLLRRTIPSAFLLLDEIENEYPTEEYKDEINYWRGWAFMLDDDWEKAAVEFSKINSSHELKSLCNTVAESKYSVIFAKVISYLLPGSGYFYTGEYFPGILSLCWNIIGGYFTIDAIANNRIFDAFVIGELGWLRFYRGSVEGAEKSAILKNLNMANSAYRFLKNKYEGIQP